MAHDVCHFSHIYGYEELNSSLVCFRQCAECSFNDVNWPFRKEFRHVEVDKGPVSLSGSDEVNDRLDMSSYSMLLFLLKTYVAVAEEQVILNVIFISS